MGLWDTIRKTVGKVVSKVVETVKKIDEPAAAQRVETKAKVKEVVSKVKEKVSGKRKDDRKVEEEVPEGRAKTDIEAETKLRDQGLMTVQTGVDDAGFPITQVIPIEGYKEASAEAQKADIALAVDLLTKGLVATPGV
ncbi:unnamed protein product, partial [marine sediment metagenome]